FRLRDYWFDIGNFSDYRKANFALIEKTGRANARFDKNTITKNSKLTPPVLVGAHSSIGFEAKLGPYAVLGKNVLIGRGVRVSNSIIFDDVKIGEKSTVTGAIVGSNSTIGKGVRIERGAVISPTVSISDGVRVGKGAVVHPHKEITRHISDWAQVM